MNVAPQNHAKNYGMSVENLFDFCVRRFRSGQPFTANHAMTYAIRRLDARLRCRQHIFEFSCHPHCLLRLALRRVGTDFTLPDGLSLRRGTYVGELHLWNEHILPIPADGPNFVWAKAIRRRMRESLALLAESARADSRLSNVEIFSARTGLGGNKPHAHFERLMKSFGFERVQELKCTDWRERWVGVGESLHLWALLYAFNPGALADHRLIQMSFRQLWMSRVTLLKEYPRGSRTLVARLDWNERVVRDHDAMGLSPTAPENALAWRE